MKCNCRANGPYELNVTYSFRSETGAPLSQSGSDATGGVVDWTR